MGAEQQLQASQFEIIHNFGHLSEPSLVAVKLADADYPLASLLECMRLVLFIFIITVSVTLSDLASSSFALIVDVVCNFDRYFARFVPSSYGQ